MALSETGGKATRPTPEPGQAQSQKSLIDWVRESFENARAKGNAANERRYGEILDLYTGLEKSQKDRWGGIDKRFDKLVQNLDTRSDKIGDQIADIADTAIKEVTGRGKERIEDVASKYSTGRKGLQDLSDKATGDIKDVGEEAREGVRARGKADLADLRRQAEGVGERAREDYKGVEERGRKDYADVERRGRAERKGTEADVLGGYKGQQAEQVTGSQRAKGELGELFARARGEQAGAAAKGIGETQERFDRGRGEVRGEYGEAEKRAGGLSADLSSQIGNLSASALRDLTSRAEGRLADLGADYEGFGAEQQDRMAAGREQVGGRMGALRGEQAGLYGGERERATGAAGEGRERVTGEYAAGREEAGGRYAGRTERGLGMYGEMGDAALARIDRQFDEQKEQTVAKIQQSMIARGMDNTTVRQAVDRAEADIERNRQEAIANVESNVRQQQAGAFERLSGTEQAAQDRLQAAGLGAGAQMTSAELAGDRQLGGQSLASAERLGQADVGAEAQAIGRAEGAGQQIGLAGLAQQAAGKQGISAAEQAIGRQGLGEQTGALRQGAAAQLGLLGQGAGAAAGVTQAGLSAEQQQAMAKLSSGIALSQQEIASIQGIIGRDLQAQQQTGLAGLSAQERMAAGRAAAGQQAGMAGAGAATQAGLAGAAAGTQSGLSGVAQQAAGQGALLGADRAMAGQTAAGQFGQIGQGSAQQAAMLGQELGERGTGQRQLTGIEGQLAGQGAGGAIGNLAQQQAAQSAVGQQQIGSAEAAGLGLSQTAQNRMDFMERRTDTIPSWESYADLVKAAGAAGHGVGSVGGVMPTGTGGGGNNAAQQQQMEWMRGQIAAGQAREQAAREQEREDAKGRLRAKAEERQAERDRDAVRRKEEKATREENQKRFDDAADKLHQAREENQIKTDDLQEQLRQAEFVGNNEKSELLERMIADAKLREENLIKGQEASDAATSKANAEGGTRGNITINVTTGAVTVGPQTVKAGDDTMYQGEDENGNETYYPTEEEATSSTGGGQGGGTPPPTGGGFGDGQDQTATDWWNTHPAGTSDPDFPTKPAGGGEQPKPAGEQPKPGTPPRPERVPEGSTWDGELWKFPKSEDGTQDYYEPHEGIVWNMHPDGSYSNIFDDGDSWTYTVDGQKISETIDGNITHYDPTTGDPTLDNKPYKPPAGEGQPKPAPERPANVPEGSVWEPNPDDPERIAGMWRSPLGTLYTPDGRQGGTVGNKGGDPIQGADGKPLPEQDAGEQPIQTGSGVGDDVPAGSKWDERIQKWIDPDGGMYNAFGGKETLGRDGDSEEFKKYFENLPADVRPWNHGTEGVPGQEGQQGPAGQPSTGQIDYSQNPWGQGSYNDFMQAQLAGGQNEGLAGLADAAGGGAPSTGLVAGSEGGMQGGGGAQTTGIVRGDEGGMSAMGRLGAAGAAGQPGMMGAAGQPQAEVFPGNAMMGLRRPGGGGMNFDPNAGEFADDPIAAKQAAGMDIGRNPAAQADAFKNMAAGGQPAGGQQLEAKEPINDQQMEAMMPVMPNVGGDGSALGLGVGGMWDIHQTGVNKIYGPGGVLDRSSQGGGGGGGGGLVAGGGGGGSQGGGGGDAGGGGGQRPRPWSQDVIHPEADPRDIAGTQGGERRPVMKPGIPGGGGFGTGEPQILTNTGGGYVNPSTRSGGIGNPNANVGGGTAPVNNQWEGWDFVKQGGGGLAGLSGQARSMPMASNQSVVSKAGPQVMPMAPNQGMVQAPQSLPMAPGMSMAQPSAGLNSLATKAKKPRNITLNQMYRK